jgi:hypothetical protein
MFSPNAEEPMASKASKKTSPNTAYLEEQAEAVRESLAGTTRLPEVFAAAAEVGYLTALADGVENDEERAAVVMALEVLSKGFVVEWETETFIDEAKKKLDAQGADARCTEVGERLKSLGHAEAGLLIGAIVAHASAGIDKSEASVLEKIGAAAGIDRKQVVAIVKKARA